MNRLLLFLLLTLVVEIIVFSVRILHMISIPV